MEIRKNDWFLAYKDGVSLLAEKEFGIKLSEIDIPEKIPKELLENYTDARLGSRYIALSMVGDSWGNCYSADKIGLVVSHWIENGYEIVLLGAGRESDRYYAEVESKVRSEKLINLSGRTNVFQSMKIIQNAALLIGIDSAMAHVAFLFHVPSVIQMANHQFSREVYGHDCDYVQYLSVPLECSGCKACKYGGSPMKGLCIQQVTSDQIIEAVSRYVGK